MKLTAAKILRVTVLVVVWGSMTYMTVQHQKCGGGPEGVPTVHALCPFGGAATLYKIAADREFVRRTEASAVILLGGTLLLALVLRRAFCGWLCPMGAMQELFATIGRRLGWRRPLHSNVVDANTRWVKYLVLLLVLAFTYITGELIFSPYDPWAAYSHLYAGLSELKEEFAVGSILLVLSLLGSVFVDRPFCRYLCPFGALLAPVSRVGLARVVRNETSCVHCGRCDQSCPVDIRVETMPQVATGECISCGECVGACPVPGTLQFKAAGRTISPVMYGIAAVVIFFGVVFATKAAGVWQSRPSSMEQITEYGGILDASNIRGFMSFNQIGESYGVSVGKLISQLDLPDDTDRDTPVKDLMKPLGREVEEIRAKVSELIGAPVTSEASPARAVERQPGTAPSPGGIKGTMTLNEIAETYSIEVEQVLHAADLPGDTDRDKPLKEIMKPLGREVQEIRQAVGELQDQ